MFIILRKDVYEVRFGLKLENKKEYFNGSYKKFVDLIGIENTKLVFEEFKGQQISFPLELYTKQYIYEQIYSEFDGENYKQLARKYGYSERTIRRILKDLIG